MANELNPPQKPTLLASALDWGLGHTTRCVPILKAFKVQGFHLIIAGTSEQIKILQTELPDVDFRTIPGYNINYSSHKLSFFTGIIRQLPRIFKTIAAEKKWVKSVLKNEKIDIIFSDNRPGFYNKTIHSVYMTHQLSIKTGLLFSDKIATLIHRHFYNKFSECWIPDDSNLNISGTLSKYNRSDPAKRLIGLLSRFNHLQTEKIYKLAVILSGPEPQRTIFENIILNQIRYFNEPLILVRGLVSSETAFHGFSENISIINYASAEKLNKIVNQSEYIICRSGYSSIMDLIKTRSKAILIPTPGQGEQEYLARHLSQKGFFMCSAQRKFDISVLLKNAEKSSLKIPETDFNKFSQEIHFLKTKLETTTKNDAFI